MTTWATPPLWVPGPTPGSAANLQAMSDDLNVIGGAWATYTPILTAATTNPTMGATILTGRYRLAGKNLDLQINMTIGSGFSGGTGTWRLSFPSGLTPVVTDASTALGIGTARDVSVPTIFTLFAYYLSSTAFAMERTDAQTGVSGVNPMTFTTGDLISFGIKALELV